MVSYELKDDYAARWGCPWDESYPQDQLPPRFCASCVTSWDWHGLKDIETFYTHESTFANRYLGDGTDHSVSQPVKPKRKSNKTPKPCLFHESCWNSLMKQFDEQPCRERLIEVLGETPLLSLDHQEEDANPIAPLSLNTYDIQLILGYWKVKSTLPEPGLTMRGHNVAPSPERDCFLLLPLEILLQVVALLSIPDFLNLRLASRVVTPIFEIQSFWKRRFHPQAERGYFNSFTDADCDGDWRMLYCCTDRDNDRFPLIALWKKVWLRNRWIKDRYDMIGDPEDQQPYQNTLHWDKTSAPIQCDRQYRRYRATISERAIKRGICFQCEYYHPLKHQIIDFPTPILQINVSILDEEEHTFISGFDLIFSERRNLLGYRVPDRQVTLNLRGQLLRGFEMMIGRGGIHAIRPITDQAMGDESYNGWVGKPLRKSWTLKKVRLEPNGEIRAISGYFDHCQMVKLALGSPKQERRKKKEKPRTQKTRLLPQRKARERNAHAP